MEQPIDRIFMLSVNARKGGLVVCLTRFVHFGKLPEALRTQYEATVYVDCMLMAHTRPGPPAREDSKRASRPTRRRVTPTNGSSITRAGRLDISRATIGPISRTPDVVALNQPFCWNPSITGTKSEDTILATADGPELITRTIFFPTLTVEVCGHPSIRPAILEKE